MKHNKFKHQVEASVLDRMKDGEDSLFSLVQETKPSRLDNRFLRDKRHDDIKNKKADRWH